MEENQKNVLGEDLEECSVDPVTGWFRDGCCNTDNNDLGVHTVCAKVNNEFLEWCKQDGNDLITPHLEYGFPGLTLSLSPNRIGSPCPSVHAEIRSVSRSDCSAVGHIISIGTIRSCQSVERRNGMPSSIIWARTRFLLLLKESATCL